MFRPVLLFQLKLPQHRITLHVSKHFSGPSSKDRPIIGLSVEIDLYKPIIGPLTLHD